MYKIGKSDFDITDDSITKDGEFLIKISDIKTIQVSNATGLYDGFIYFSKDGKTLSLAKARKHDLVTVYSDINSNKIAADLKEAIFPTSDAVLITKQPDANINPRLQEIINDLIQEGITDIDLWGTKKELATLPEILDANEHVKFITSGLVDSGTVMIVISDKRLMFIDRGMIYGTNYREIPFKKINSVSYKTGLVLAEVLVENGATTTQIKSLRKVDAPKFVTILKNAIASASEEIKEQAISSSSVADELLKFKQLLDMGAISEEEFKAQKDKLLK